MFIPGMSMFGASLQSHIFSNLYRSLLCRKDNAKFATPDKKVKSRFQIERLWVSGQGVIGSKIKKITSDGGVFQALKGSDHSEFFIFASI